jgi:transposase
MVHSARCRHERPFGEAAHEARRRPPAAGRTKNEGARAFRMSRSSVKRYAKLAEEGRPLAPNKRPGSRPKRGEIASRLLEVDLEECPAATLSQRRREYLGRVAGVSVSESTVSRMLGRLVWSRKQGR